LVPDGDMSEARVNRIAEAGAYSGSNDPCWVYQSEPPEQTTPMTFNYAHAKSEWPHYNPRRQWRSPDYLDSTNVGLRVLQ
jgi:hypothetical protein